MMACGVVRLRDLGMPVAHTQCRALPVVFLRAEPATIKDKVRHFEAPV